MLGYRGSPADYRLATCVPGARPSSINALERWRGTTSGLLVFLLLPLLRLLIFIVIGRKLQRRFYIR
jgi:hypothetical protein